MGIHGLAKLIADQAPGAIREQDIKNYFGRHYIFCLLILLFIIWYTLLCISKRFTLIFFWRDVRNKQLFICISAGRKIAIDASMCIYQFLIAVRQDGNVLQNDDGETTRYSHSKIDTLTTVKMLLLVQKDRTLWPQSWNGGLFSVTWWGCSTGPSVCWSMGSNLCMCLMASPHNSNHQRLDLYISDF